MTKNPGLANRVKTQLLGGGVASDSVMLLSVKVLTAIARIVQTMILSRALTVDAYGTYSQALLVIALFAPFFSLGLDSAINYFFNTSKDDEERQRWIDTIFGIAWAAGIFGAILLMLLRGGVASYYHNDAIIPLMLYICLRPALQDIIADYQNLYISSGMAKAIAIRNGIVSVAQVAIIAFAVLVTDDLILLFVLLLGLDVVQALVFARYFGSRRFSIRPWRIDLSKLKPVLVYAIPMLLASSLGTISNNLDRILISNLMSVEDFALFSNMAQELPFSFVVSSFTAVVTPAVVRLLARQDMDAFKSLWGDYLEFGYTVTWPLCFAAFVCAPQMVEFLYSDTYLSDIGVAVFRVYLLVAMFRFSYFGMVPTALGKSRVVLFYTAFCLALTLPLTLVLYWAMGMVGASLAAVVAMAFSTVLYFRKSTKLTGVKALDVLRIKQMALLVLQMLVLSAVSYLILSTIDMHVVVACLVTFLLVGCGTFFIRAKRIGFLISSMNSIKNS